MKHTNMIGTLLMLIFLISIVGCVNITQTDGGPTSDDLTLRPEKPPLQDGKKPLQRPPVERPPLDEQAGSEEPERVTKPATVTEKPQPMKTFDGEKLEVPGDAAITFDKESNTFNVDIYSFTKKRPTIDTTQLSGASKEECEDDCDDYCSEEQDACEFNCGNYQTNNCVAASVAMTSCQAACAMIPWPPAIGDCMDVCVEAFEEACSEEALEACMDACQGMYYQLCAKECYAEC